MHASYIAGDWVAISAPSRWLLVQLPPYDETVRRCWERIHVGADVEDMFDLLMARGIRSTPAFALVWLTDAERRAVARGTGVVRVRSDGQVVDIVAGERMAWVDRTIDAGFDEITLFGGTTGGSNVALPMAAGVALAAAVLLSRQELPVLRSGQSSVAPAKPGPAETENGPDDQPSYDHLFRAT